MKFRVAAVVLLLFSFLTACTVLIDFFMDLQPLSVDGCIVDVSVLARERLDYELDNIFINLSAPNDGLDIASLFDVGDSDPIRVGPGSLLSLEGRFNVRRFAYYNGVWYFNIFANVTRLIIETETLFGGQHDDNIKDITDNEWVWVDGRYVTNFDDLQLDCDETGETIDVLSPGSESVSRLYLCRIDVAGDTEGRVGPGTNRSVRAYITPNDEGYGVTGSTVDDMGDLWYEVDVPNVGLLWVLESQTDETRLSNNTDPLTGETNTYATCSTGTVPQKAGTDLIIAGSRPSGASFSVTNCRDFAILSPIGFVPTEPSFYEWTKLEGATDYIISFSDYQGNWVSSLTVDGSLNRLRINTGEIPTGSQLSFVIVARIDGNIVCSANSGTLTRTAGFAAPQEEPAPEENNNDDDDKDDGGYKPPKI